MTDDLDNLSIRELHDLAMEAVDLALKLRREGDDWEDTMHDARLYETIAALRLKNDFTLPVTRAVLYRSAASIAWEMGMFEESLSLIVTGLEGDPPAEIKQELLELEESIRASIEEE